MVLWPSYGQKRLVWAVALYLTDTEGVEETLPAVNRMFSMVDQQDQR